MRSFTVHGKKTIMGGGGRSFDHMQLRGHIRNFTMEQVDIIKMWGDEGIMEYCERSEKTKTQHPCIILNVFMISNMDVFIL